MFKNTKKNTKNTNSINVNEALTIAKRIEQMASDKTLSSDDKEILKKGADLINTLITIYGMWVNSKKKISNLLRMIFGNRSEKSKIDNQLKESEHEGNNIFNSECVNSSDNRGGNESYNASEDLEKSDKEEIKEKVKESGCNKRPINPEAKDKRKGGKGRNSADEYENAAEINCKLCDNQEPGQICPLCGRSKLFEIDPKKVIRLVGNSPVTAFKFVLQQTKCVCGAIFTADVGDELREVYEGEKYSPSALAIIIILKYLMGGTFGRLEKMQKNAGIPLPASTQANKIKIMALPVFQAINAELVNLATNAHVIGFDDTKICTLEKRTTINGNKTSKGYGTAIVAKGFDEENNHVILFNFDVNKHGGQVIFELVANRKRNDLPILVSDAFPSYDGCKSGGIDSNCNVHARRKVIEDDPDQKGYVCKEILLCYRAIYKNEDHCRKENYNDQIRMEYHIEHSTWYFEKITTIFNIVMGVVVNPKIKENFGIPNTLFPDEPNGSTYKAAKYFIDRKGALTIVLRVPGAPLDTNFVEIVIKIIIIIRKNSLFFNNHFSACYAAEILSVLETANYAKINVFEYVEYILANKEDALKNPKKYLPWLYKKSEEEKKVYWENFNELLKAPANLEESEGEKRYHSSE